MTAVFERVHRLVKVYSVVFVFWGLYRLIFRLPEAIEEVFLKPLLFVGTVLVIEKPRRWGRFFADVWGKGDWLRASILGLVFGLAYVLVYGLSSFLSFGRLDLVPLAPAEGSWPVFVAIGFVTAVWEEWLFSGYLFGELRRVFSGLWLARLTSAALFGLIHVPVLVFWYQFTLPVVMFQLVLLFGLGVTNVVLFGWTKNLLAPIFSHTLWGVAMFLFR